MFYKQKNPWLPKHVRTKHLKVRRVGVEIEFAELSPEQVLSLIKFRFGGEIESETMFEHTVTNTDLGDFKLELDADGLKKHAKFIDEWKDNHTSEKSLSARAVDFYSELMGQSAEHLVPWEVVTAPIPMTKLEALNELIIDLKAAGAAGTRDSLQYAFGVHLNPELPDLDVDAILKYLRAFMILSEWLRKEENVDVSRRITPYIDPFGRDYMRKVLDFDYLPGMDELIDDYLAFNPTRNRSLDMLPLFAHIDEERVRAAVDDPRIKPRPTLHYRLPNCEFGNPDWDLQTTWGNWLWVEALAHSSELESFANDYLETLDSVTHHFVSSWPEKLEKRLEQLDEA